MPSSQAAAVIDVGRVESFSLPSKPRLNLVYIKTNTSSYLLRCQLFQHMVCKGSCSDIQWRRFCMRDRRQGAIAKTLGRSLMLDLHALKAIHNQTGVVSVITLSQAMGALAKAKVPASIRAELQAAVSQPALSVVPRGDCPASTSYLDLEGLHLCSQLPTALPEDFPTFSFGQRMSLSQDQAACEHPILRAQLAAFSDFFTKQWNLARETSKLGGKSIKTIKEDLLYILGYLKTHKGIDYPNLYHVVQAEWVIGYLAGRVQAGLSQGAMGHDLDAVTKVVQFWMQQPGAGAVSEQLQALEKWLHRLAKQMRRAVPQVRKQPVAMQAAGKWATAAQLVKCFEAARVRVVGQVYARLQQQAGGELGLMLAQDLQDVTLANMLFGYLPPMRLECIMTMTRPGAGVLCQEEDCTLGPSCAGNRLERTAGDGIKLVFPHHKNRRTWGVDIILEAVPAELAELFNLYLDHAMPTLCSHLPKAQQHGRVFFTPTGLPHANSLSYHFKRILVKLGMPESTDICPQHLRHIFIDERSAANPVAGPNDRGAALVMGNSVAAWGAWYQLSRWDGRAAQRAADEMQPWRAAMVQPASSNNITMLEDDLVVDLDMM